MKLTDDNILQANINRTKQYVRDNGGKVSTLPTATSSNVGQIYQYTGATTLTYTHGYFYECKENNGTYSWVNVPVSEGSGGGHTILNGSGSAMNQRGKLQFDGLNVSDDSGNDKTVVKLPIPCGATITPTGDISIWLKCAGLQQTYNTLSDVLADSVILEILMDSTNAVDYLARSNTWSSDICANETAMTYIGTNNYCANILLADSTWRTAICNSAYFESVLNVKVPNMTSDTTPIGEGTVVYHSQYSGTEAYRAFSSSGEYLPAVNETTSQFYLGFCFDVETLVEKVYIKARTYTTSHYYDIALYGGNSLSGLTKLSSDLRIQNNTGGQEYTTILSNNTKYKYYVWKVTGSNMSYTHQSGVDYLIITRTQFYGRNDKEILPAPLAPDYVDEQFNSSKIYSKGMTCIEGNVRYRYKNSTATSGHRPPDTTYWEVLSVASELQAIGNKLILPHLFYRGYSNTAMGSMTGISGHSGKSLSVVDDYLTGGNAGTAWYGTYYSTPIDLSNCNRIYVEIENTVIIDSSTSAMYQLMLFNTTPVWNGCYVATVIMDRQGDSYAINYSQGTHIFCKDLSSFSASQKANTYVGIGFFGNSTNSHIKQIWVA